MRRGRGAMARSGWQWGTGTLRLAVGRGQRHTAHSQAGPPGPHGDRLSCPGASQGSSQARPSSVGSRPPDPDGNFGHCYAGRAGSPARPRLHARDSESAIPRQMAGSPILTVSHAARRRHAAAQAAGLPPACQTVSQAEPRSATGTVARSRAGGPGPSRPGVTSPGALPVTVGLPGPGPGEYVSRIGIRLGSTPCRDGVSCGANSVEDTDSPGAVLSVEASRSPGRRWPGGILSLASLEVPGPPGTVAAATGGGSRRGHDGGITDGDSHRVTVTGLPGPLSLGTDSPAGGRVRPGGRRRPGGVSVRRRSAARAPAHTLPL
jgi:hypothetical protein